MVEGLWQAGEMAPLTRARALQRLGAAPFDVLVIGGGMTGCGIAVDAATRGLSVALVEAEDWASGTSSKSSKLVHGGLRYLQQREFRLVYENLRERQRLLRNAPHLVSVLPFLIPMFGKDGIASKAVVRSYKTALWLYDLTGGVRIGKRHKQVNRAQALEHLPKLRTDRLVAGFIYFDARGDDARVALDLARTAEDHGAVIASYAPVTGLLRDPSGRVTGAIITPSEISDAGPIEIQARVIVNAAGVFVDEVSSLDHDDQIESIIPAKGVHLSVRSDRLPCDIAAVLPVAEDRRSIFVLPWDEGGYAFIGTTDTSFEGDLHDPECTPVDVAYLLGAVNAATTAALTPEDVTGVWAGLRPLRKSNEGRSLSHRTADLSRRHKVETADDGVVLVTGGKWTTYRQMAQDTVDELGRQLPGLGPCQTRSLLLHGAPEGPQPRLGAVDPIVESHLRSRFGTDAETLIELIAEDAELGARLSPSLPYLKAEVIFAARHEMALHLDDVLCRRMRAHLIDARASLAAAPAAAALMGLELGWDVGQIVSEVAAYEDLVRLDLGRAGLEVG